MILTTVIQMILTICNAQKKSSEASNPSRCLGFSGRITSAKGKNASEKIHIILAKLMLVTDVGDKICCKQVLDVGDGFGHFGHQHTLFYQGLNFLINTQNGY